jgi:hypothetical protein
MNQNCGLMVQTERITRISTRSQEVEEKPIALATPFDSSKAGAAMLPVSELKLAWFQC